MSANIQRSLAATAAPEAPQSERLHALDAVRGFALLLGIVFHSTMSFLVAPGPFWLVVDKSPSATLTVMFFVLHMFRMVTFFLIAGFFAHLMFHRRGERGFIRDRLRRIGLPLVVGWPFLIVALIACGAWGGYVMTGKVPEPPPPDPHAPPLAFPLTHLWFLYVLLWFYVCTVALRRTGQRAVRRRCARAPDVRRSAREGGVAAVVRHSDARQLVVAERRCVHSVR